MKTALVALIGFCTITAWARKDDLSTQDFGAQILVSQNQSRTELLRMASDQCRKMGLIKAVSLIVGVRKIRQQKTGQVARHPVIHTIRCVGTDSAIIRALYNFDILQGPEDEATARTSDLAKSHVGAPASR